MSYVLLYISPDSLEHVYLLTTASKEWKVSLLSLGWTNSVDEQSLIRRQYTL